MTLPYRNDDDQAARRFIDSALRHQNPKAWAELVEADYAEQTYRILVQIEQSIQTAFAARAGENQRLLADREAGLVSLHEMRTKTAEYGEWKTRTNHFRGLVTDRLAEVRRAKKDANRARWTQRKLTENDHLRLVLARLADAVARHRRDCTNPTTEDRLLWARLDTLTLPDGEPGRPAVTLAEYAERRLAREDAAEVAS